LIVLSGCAAIGACSRTQATLMQVMDDPDPDAYRSWTDMKTLDGPLVEFKGEAHDLGSRTIYFNEAAAMANNAGTDYPVGSMIVKESMDMTNSYLSQISTMTKTESAENGGWAYGVTGPPAETAEAAVDPMGINNLSAEMAAGACVGCHTFAADTDFVFVKLAMEMEGMTEDGMEGMTEDGMEGMTEDGMEGMTEDGMEDMTEDGMEGMTEDGMEDMTGNGGTTNGNGDGNGNGA
ncbi:hypothetical protein F4225_02350, partial [Candidatus Poribacteria bacterium]|nr:hypothetical protein [Candidatus Poribacteria bacterium]